MNEASQKPMLRRRVAVSLSLIAMLMLSACGGGGGAAGSYRHETEGLVVLEEGGGGFVDQSTDDTTLDQIPLTWTADGQAVTITFENGNSVDAELRDGALVFPPDVWSCCDEEEAVFSP